MAEQSTVYRGWLTTRNGDKYAPATLISNVFSDNGTPYDNTVKNYVKQAKSETTETIETVKNSQKWAENDIGLSVAHYCLQAAELGLGTCIIGMVEEDKVREYFGIEDKVRLVIATGYSADESPRNKVRKSKTMLDEMAVF